MICRSLAKEEYSKHLHHTDNGLVAYRDEAPAYVIKEFEEINAEYRKILRIEFIKIKDKASEED